MSIDAYLARIDAVEADDVPGLCLVLADWLAERGDGEADRWFALGRLGKVPIDFIGHYYWTGRQLMVNVASWDLPHEWVSPAMSRVGHKSVSSALRTAARAFLQLDERTRTRILTREISSL